MSSEIKPKTLPLGKFLFERIKQTNSRKVFGVPGDYNLQLLDYIANDDSLKWIGCCNELNAAYAADGYARATGSPGLLVTTFGVGEMSAMNGISGAHAENIPILHIVGMTPRFAQDLHLVLHHSPRPIELSPNDHKTYVEAEKPFNVCQEILWDSAKAPQQIDRVITEVNRKKAPGTIYIPSDMFHEPVDPTSLEIPLDWSWPVHKDTDTVVDEIIEKLKKSDKIAVVADMYAVRFAMKDSIHELLEKTGALGYTTHLSRSVIDEEDPHFVVPYCGELSCEGVQENLKAMDFVICIGPLPSEWNTGFSSHNFDDKKVAVLHPCFAKFLGKHYDGVHLVHVLDRVLQKLENFTPRTIEKPSLVYPQIALTGLLNQNMMPSLIFEALQPYSVAITDTGCFQCSSLEMRLKKGMHFWTQMFYGSIGYALPSAFGGALGYLEHHPNSRIYLVEGDGSAQMTVQEIANIVRHKLPVTIFLVNNSGYSIERCIWGSDKIYNDIPPNWQWLKIFEVFGAQKGDVETYHVETAEEFLSVVKKKEFIESRKPQMVEMMLPKFDYPDALHKLTSLGQAFSVYEMEKWKKNKGQ